MVINIFLSFSHHLCIGSYGDHLLATEQTEMSTRLDDVTSSSVQHDIICHFLAAEERPPVLVFRICLMDGGLFILRIMGELELIPACTSQKALKTLRTDCQCISIQTVKHMYFNVVSSIPQLSLTISRNHRRNQAWDTNATSYFFYYPLLKGDQERVDTINDVSMWVC